MFSPYLHTLGGQSPESYAGGSIATGGVSHAGQVKGDDPDKNGYPGTPGWGLKMWQYKNIWEQQ
jgi:hypothetical protein